VPADPLSSDPVLRRAPLLRFAAFFRPAHRCWLVGALLVAAGFGLWPEAPAVQAADAPGPPAKNQPKPLPPATVKLGGVAYTEARAYFARLGYKAEYAAQTWSLTLTQGAGAATSELVFTADKREARINGLRIFLGEPAILHKNELFVATLDLERFLLPILRPARFTPRPLHTIVIDAGHGGNDTGTQNKSHKLSEKIFTLDVAQRLQRLLGEGRWRVLQTRSDDHFVELPDRAAFANEAKADLFISIHFNAVANNAAVHGTETYVLTPQFQRSTSSSKAMPEDKVAYPGNRHDAWNAVLGYHMHRQLLSKLKSEDRGYKHARFAVLRMVDCPAVLVEAGYLSNDDEAKKIAAETYRSDIAEALYAAILAYEAQSGAGEAAKVEEDASEE
jgi:N-acetylmuramoyl-L-alanine amidase